MKRFLLTLVCVCIFFSVSASRIHAQYTDTTTTASPQTTKEENAALPSAAAQEQLHIYAQNVMIEVISAAACQIAGTDPTRPDHRCVNIDSQTGKLTYTDTSGGAMGFMGGMIAGTFNIPISSGDYFSDLAGNFGIAKKTYAQEGFSGGGGKPVNIVNNNYSTVSVVTPGISGDGFASLSPFLPIWKAFRNITYLLFVIVFVAIGLGIMLRINVGNRTVMTIQNQIPKIIIGIILITFSYAIAGFLIDVMWFSMYLIYNVIGGANLPHVDTTSFNPVHLRGANPVSLFGAGGIAGIAKDVSAAIGDMFYNLFHASFSFKSSGGGNPIEKVVGLITGSIANALSGFFAKILEGIAFLIISVAILISLFKLWFTLIRAYIFIILDVILAPFWIAAAILPGSSIGFGRWVRDISANLAAFPATLFLLMIGSAVADSVGKVQSQGQFVPPFIGNPAQANAVGSLLGLGLILISPQVVTMTRDILKAPGNKYAAGVGQAIRAGQGVAMAPLSMATKRLTAYNPQTGHGGAIGEWFAVNDTKGTSRATMVKNRIRGIGRMALGIHTGGQGHP